MALLCVVANVYAMDDEHVFWIGCLFVLNVASILLVHFSIYIVDS